MSQIPAEFAEAIDRYRFAAEPDVSVVHVDWPSFARFDRLARRLKVERDRYPTARSVDDDLDRWDRARALLRSSLAAPSDDDVGLATQGTDAPLVLGELGERQAELRRLEEELAADAHPGLAALQAMLDGSGKIRWPRRGVARVIVPNHARAATLRALATLDQFEDVTWEVMSLTEAKTAGHCDVTVLAGSPELLLNWRTDPGARSSLVAWLFNAPMSPHVVALLWSGSQVFDSNKYEPFPGSSVLDPRVSGKPTTGVLSKLAADEFVLPSAASRPMSKHTDARTAIDAIDFQLPDRSWISFGLEFGSRPVRIDDEDEFDLRLEKVAARDVRPGDVLVVLGAAADRSYRRELCGKWIAEQTAAFDIDGAMEKINQYKEGVRRLRYRADLVHKLKAQGMQDSYIKQQVARAHDPNTIAPRHFRDFSLIAGIVDVPVSHDDWERIVMLRGGYIHAGTEIAAQLRNAVQLDRSWIDTIAQQRIATIVVPNLGSVTLAPVLRVIDESTARAESELGVLVTS
jgi:hypothetical protein